MSKKIVTGLEITNQTIRWIQLGIKSKKIHVVHAHETSYESKAHLAEDFNKSIELLHARPQWVATSVWAPTMMVRKITMPIAFGDEQEAKILLEADKAIPFPIDQCVLDYYLISESPEKKQMDVMLVAAKRDLLNQRCEILKSAGLKILGINIHPIALTNISEELYQDAGHFLLIHIGNEPGQTKNEENFVVAGSRNKPSLIRDIGPKIFESESVDDVYTQLASQAGNALTFYENAQKEKISKCFICAKAEVAEQLKKKLLPDLQNKVVVIKAPDEWSYASSAIKTLIESSFYRYAVVASSALKCFRK